MSLCKSIFQKGLYDLTISDLESFFSTEQEETSILEFKAGGVKLEDIHKEVVAFLNTEGGILILGAPKERKHAIRSHIKVCSGSLTPAIHIRDQDTLIRSIASQISPAPSTIKAKTLDIEGGAVYILEIGQSMNPPHQVSATGIYYIRLERDAKPAPHGIVEALFFRRQKSDLRVETSITVKPSNCYAVLTFLFRNESLIHVEKYGWLLRLHGVRMCTQLRGDKMEDIHDDTTKGTDEIDTILVKGMHVRIEFEIMLRFPALYFEFSYYSKDNTLQGLQVLYDTEQNKCLFLTDKNHSERNIGECEDIYAEYEKKLAQKILHFLKKGFFYNEILKPAIPEVIDELEYEFDIQLPRSLIIFWLLTDGFHGLIGDCPFNIASVNQVMDYNSPQKYAGKNKILQIGSINEKAINLKYKNGAASFEWFSVGGGYKNGDFTSFFDLLDDLRPLIKY